MAEQRYFLTVEDRFGRRARVLISSHGRALYLRDLFQGHNLTCGFPEPIPDDFSRTDAEEELALGYLDLILGSRID